MKTALVVNCSGPSYNLGARKLADWLRASGYAVEDHHDAQRVLRFGKNLVGTPDLVCLSVIFSWDAPIAREIALRWRDRAEVWCGGPGMTALVHWWQTETGLTCSPGIDARFEKQRGDYIYTFAARGCPVGCWFCVVPKLEGKTFTLDWDFRPAPVLCDNNLSALPDAFQDHIIARYAESGVVLKDCNSGFEPRAFTEATYARWTGKFKSAWRFAYDEMKESGDVQRMMEILRDEKPRKKQVYVLVGNEPIASCYQRAQEVIAWGGEPYCQFVLPLNWLGDPAEIRPRHDWTYALGRDFCRYFNRHLWRGGRLPLADYKPRVNEPEPFKTLRARMTDPISITEGRDPGGEA